jgi:multiple sugar transport system permease protein
MKQTTGDVVRVKARPDAAGVRAGAVRRRVRIGRRGYLIGAICLVLCTVMLLPILASVLASVKPTEEAAASPPTYVPHSISLDSYLRLWDYQEGLPTYLFNSLGTAVLTIAFTLLLTVPAAYALARFPVPVKELIFVVLLLALIVPYQALLTPMFLMFAKVGLTNTLVGLAIVHTTIQLPFSLYVLRNSFAAVPRELEEAAIVDGASSLQALRKVFLPATVPAVVTVALFAFIMSWNEFLGALVMMSKGSSFTLPLVLAAARTETSLGGTDWGMLQAGITISIIPCVAVYLLLQRYYVSGLMSGAVK